MSECKLKRTERIKSRKTIDDIFSGGATSHSVFPIRVIYKELQTPTSILVSVSKKRFKHAVDRNRLKRLIRESYRLNKSELLDRLESLNKTLAIAFVYISNKEFSFEEVEARIKKMLTLIIEDLSKTEEDAQTPD